MLKRLLAMAAALACLSSPSWAQQYNPNNLVSASNGLPTTEMAPTLAANPTNLAVTTTSAAVAIPASVAVYPVLLLYNDGASELFWAAGGSGVTATTNSFALPAGNWIAVNAGSAGFIAAIAGSGTTTLRITQATAMPVIAGGGGGTGGGSGGTVYQGSPPWSVVVSAGTASIGKVGLQVGGADVSGANPVPISGSLSLGGSVSVSNFPATQPVSATTWPLPTGAATSALQATIAAQLPAALDGSGYMKIHEQGTASVQTPIPASLVTLQAKIATTGTAVQLSNHALVNGLTCMAKTTNAAAILFGPSGVQNVSDGTGNGAIVAPGAGWAAAVNNSNLVYINGTAGDVISCTGN